MFQDKKTVFFDMDGLLFDTERVYFETRRDVLKKYGIVFKMKDYIPYMGKSYEDSITRLSLLLESKEQGKKVFDEAMELYHQRILSNDFEIKPGVINILEYLKKESIDCYVVSSSDYNTIEKTIDLKGLDDYFTGYIGGDQVKKNKPMPDIYLLALEKANVSAGQALVFEDSRSGVQAAKDAGIEVIGVLDLIEADEFMKSNTIMIVNQIDDVKTL